LQNDAKAQKDAQPQNWHTDRRTSVLRLGLGEHQYRGAEADNPVSSVRPYGK
jgi:hypothetical protein